MEGFHPVEYLHVGGVAIDRGDEKMTETSTKKMKNRNSWALITTVIITASAHLMPDFTGPGAHDDYGDHI